MIEIVVNGRPRKVESPGETPLLWVLRDELGLTGAKFGCGSGICGSCTVHVDGDPQRACVFPLSEAEGAEVTTIEGLAEEGDHPLQQAWREERVPQCGYCQPGQIMTAAAFLRRNPDPTAEEVTRAMSGNLCRCGTYPRIHRAVLRASGREMEE